MLALNGADPLNGPRQWGSLLFCLVIVLSLQRAEGSTEETGSSYTKVRILPDYIRHGTTTLFAALNVLDGTVIGHCMARHRHQEFVRFLNRIEAAVPAGKLIHAILDN